MSATTTPLEVVLTLPPAPLVLATGGFLSSLAAVEAELAATTSLTTQEAAQQCATIQSRITTAESILEKQRKALKAPFKAAGEAIDAAAAEPFARLAAAKQRVKSLLTAYDEALRIKAANEERARQAELKRLSDIAAAEKAEADRQAAAIAADLAAKAEAARAAMPDIEVMEMDDEPPAPVQKTETEKAIERLQHAPVPVAPKPVGIAFKVTLIPTVVDIAKVPDIFVTRTANMQALRSTFCTGFSEGQVLPTCAGVEFIIKREPVSTGK